MTGTDEHIVWFESKIISSLRPRGDEVKAFISDSDSRYVIKLVLLTLKKHQVNLPEKTPELT